MEHITKYSKICLFQHEVGDNFFVDIDRLSDYTLHKTQKISNIIIVMKIKVGIPTDYTGVALDTFQCIEPHSFSYIIQISLNTYFIS